MTIRKRLAKALFIWRYKRVKCPKCGKRLKDRKDECGWYILECSRCKEDIFAGKLIKDGKAEPYCKVLKDAPKRFREDFMEGLLGGKC